MDSRLSRQLGPPAKWAAKSTGPEIGEGPAVAVCLLVLGGGLPACGGPGPSPSSLSPQVRYVLLGLEGAPSGRGQRCNQPCRPSRPPGTEGLGSQRCEPPPAASSVPRRLRPPLTALCSGRSHPPPSGQEELQVMPQKGWGQPQELSSPHSDTCKPAFTSTSSDAQASHVTPVYTWGSGPITGHPRPQG